MVAIGLAIPLILLLLALFWPQSPAPPAQGGIDFSAQLARSDAAIGVQSVAMRDGWQMPVRALDGPAGGVLLVMIHGSGWHGMQFQGLAATLSAQADVLVPDLRGHGAAPQRRGDLDYIGQFEDDIADLIAARVKPGQKVVLLGHSSGGGLVIRFAGGAHRGAISGAVLLAPFVHHAAPTTRRASGGWAKVNVPRVAALSVLNRLGITALNHLPIISFAMPQAVLDGPLGATATTAYSYRLNTSFAPRSDYLKDISALPPYLLVVGDADESFVADHYAPLFAKAKAAKVKAAKAKADSNGRFEILHGVNHLGVVDDVQTARLVTEFLARK